MSTIFKYKIVKSKLLFLLCIIISLLLKFNHTNSQELVISEYFNGQTPSDDWTELLVTADNISLEFYILRDYRDIEEGPSEKTWGIQFKQHTLWRDIRPGTIIVIHHRGIDLIDVNKDDGYIELGAENPDYFTKVNMEGIWVAQALDIRESGSILRIESNYGNHVHSLSHTQITNSTYLSFPLPKLNFPGICPVGESISVTPGRNLSDYDGEINSERCTVSHQGNYVTMGKPNKRQNFLDDNLLFWQKLRTPLWIDNKLNANIKPDFIELIWSPIAGNYSDSVQGYLILRILQQDTAFSQNPVNGTSYTKGDSIGSSLVVENVNASKSTTFVDDFPFNCNESYVYRIFSYRFGQDDLLGNGIVPSYARGRTYNLTNFAEGTVRKTPPAKPTIRTEADKTQFCSGDSLLITANVFGGPYVYEWYLDSQPIPNSNKKIYYAKSQGSYKVIITNEKGCSAESDSIQLNVMPSPTAVIKLNGIQILKDTTLTLCENESHLLKVSGGNRYEWFKNYVKLTNTTDELQITEEGSYFAVAINNGMLCTDTSVRITLDVTHIAYDFDKDTLYFYLDKYTKYEDKAVRVSNSSTDTLLFSEIMIPPGGIFSVFVPPPSEVVLPNRSKDYTIRFEPNRSGDYFDSIIFILPCKNSMKKVYLFAHKERMNVEANPSIANFDTLISCENDSLEIIITVTNNENFDIEIAQPKTESPFSVVSVDFPKTLVSNNSTDIKVKFKSAIPDYYTKNLIIPFSANGINDELLVELKGKVLNSSYRLEFYGQPLTEINFPGLTGCDDSTYSAFQIFNTGEIDLEFSTVKEIPGIYLNDFPIVIKPNRSKEIPVLFVPQQEGVFSGTLLIATNPCSYIDSVKLKGSKYGITYGMNKQKISFDSILNCVNPGVITDRIDLIVSGQSQETPYIAKISGPTYNYFSHNIVQGMTLADTNRFKINLESLNVGEYFDTLRILIKPCDFEKIIPLYGKRINPELSLSTDTLNFANVAIETSDTNSIILHNTGELGLIVSDIQTIIAPFKILTKFPITLQPDSSAEIFFEYSPMQMKSDKLKLNVLMSEPCDMSFDLWLIGMGDVPKYIGVEISVPELTVGELAKDVIVPISIRNLGNRTLDEAKISNLVFGLRYNPTLLYPKTVSIGNAFTNSTKHILEFDETPPGLLNINCVVDTSDKISNGVLFNIKFLALLGNNIKTAIIFENMEIKSSIEIIPDTSGGCFKLIGACSLDERLLNIEGNLNLSLISENPIMNDVGEFEVELPFEANTELVLFDVNGNCITTLMNGIYPPGKYFINFNTEKFSAGIYIALLKHGTSSISLRLVVIK
ncbi:MAG: hypothetical protein V1779_05045 [bacterium]